MTTAFSWFRHNWINTICDHRRAGGVGKTTIAVAVGQAPKNGFDDAYFVDLSELNDPKLVALTLASMLGLYGRSADPTSGNIGNRVE